MFIFLVIGPAVAFAANGWHDMRSTATLPVHQICLTDNFSVHPCILHTSVQTWSSIIAQTFNEIFNA